MHNPLHQSIYSFLAEIRLSSQGKNAGSPKRLDLTAEIHILSPVRRRSAKEVGSLPPARYGHARCLSAGPMTDLLSIDGRTHADVFEERI